MPDLNHAKPASALETTTQRAHERWLLPALPALLRGADGAQWRHWLGRARRLTDSGYGPRHALADALGQPLAQLPWVHAQARADLPQALAETAVVRADRIRSRVDGFALRLTGLNDALLAAPLQQQLTEVVNELCADVGLRLQQAPGGRQYLCGMPGEDLDGPQTLPPDALLGTDLADALPTALRWRRLLNDVQICLNQSGPNQAGHGVIQADGYWFWGDSRAELTQLVEPGWVQLEDAEIKALTDLLGWKGEPGSATAGLREGPSAQPGGIADALRCGPLLLCYASGERFELRPRDRWRFWASHWKGDPNP
jgi:hypothetical protein